MDKIVTHPLYLQAKRVINSCETQDQFVVAKKYIFLCIKNHYKELKNKSFNSAKLWYDIQCFYDLLINEKDINSLK